MTLHGTDLVAIAAMIGAAFAGCYALLLRRMHSALTERQMKIADQIASLDDAIRALETRFADHQQQWTMQLRALQVPEIRNRVQQLDGVDAGQEGSESEVAPEIQAAIAAAAVATLGPDAVVKSVKPVTSPWTQQGRVLVQGGHNLRVQR